MRNKEEGHYIMLTLSLCRLSHVLWLCFFAGLNFAQTSNDFIELVRIVDIFGGA